MSVPVFVSHLFDGLFLEDSPPFWPPWNASELVATLFSRGVNRSHDLDEVNGFRVLLGRRVVSWSRNIQDRLLRTERKDLFGVKRFTVFGQRFSMDLGWLQDFLKSYSLHKLSGFFPCKIYLRKNGEFTKIDVKSWNK